MSTLTANVFELPSLNARRTTGGVTDIVNLDILFFDSVGVATGFDIEGTDNIWCMSDVITNASRVALENGRHSVCGISRARFHSSFYKQELISYDCGNANGTSGIRGSASHIKLSARRGCLVTISYTSYK